ncbi:eukaryotic translation initiation factor 3 subunit C-like [Condylostylus longicornis]|uniref:eukaryotic translation initiation factor 3 subunit C-like n=1 Tax=Condylostylus longicornis TaxID=2530218 RepID=UPI00244DC545|nr:eukaryotic translation initiation factor 3 subunit C-like [Condylostylus longicornis]
MSMKFWASLPDSAEVKEILTNRIKEEALRTYLFSYSSLYDSFNIKQLSEMFNLPVSTAHSIVSKMMIQGALSGSWDESSECVLINRVERTPLQVLALQLTEKIAQAVDQNEVMLNYRNPKYVMAQANQREDRGVRRYDERWGGNEQRRFYGREDQQDRPFSQYRPQAINGARSGNRPGVSTQRRRW